MNLPQPVKFPPILIIEFLGFLLPSLPACTLYKDENLATTNQNIKETIVAVDDLKI